MNAILVEVQRPVLGLVLFTLAANDTKEKQKHFYEVYRQDAN